MSREFQSLGKILSTSPSVSNQRKRPTDRRKSETPIKEKIKELVSQSFKKPSFSNPLSLSVFKDFKGSVYTPKNRLFPRVHHLTFLSESPVEVKSLPKLPKSELNGMELYAVDGSARSVNRVELSLLLGQGVGFGWAFDGIDSTIDSFEEVEILTFSHDLLSSPHSKVMMVKDMDRKRAVTSRVSSLRIEMERKAFKQGVKRSPDVLLIDGPLYHPNFGNDAFELVQQAEDQGTMVIGLSKTSYARNFVNMADGTIENFDETEVRWLQRYADDVAFFETKVGTGERGAIWRRTYRRLPKAYEPIVGYLRLGETLYKVEIPFKHKERLDTYVLPLLRRLSTLRIENDDPFPLDEAHNESTIDESRFNLYQSHLDSLFENEHRYELHKLRRRLTP